MDFVHPVEAVIPGAQGRVLAVLAETTAELSLRTLARLAGVSVAQASRVMPDLVELGLVERREVPPSSQFRLVRSNVAARAVIELAKSRVAVLERIGAAAAELPIPPASVIVFGSFARGEAGPQSDLDVVVVRPDDVPEDDDAWAASLGSWCDDARAIAGNPVEILQISRAEWFSRLTSDAALWRNVARDGVVVHGLSVGELSEAIDA
ncbi:MAG: nucleotidyltransferase domain-containing protein [Acidimicrobiia bacterium]